MTALFVTGTDTDCGKTVVTLALMHALQKQKLNVNGFKPVAAGVNEAQLNADAVSIQDKSSLALPYEQINPYLFEPAIAPHIAAKRVDIDIDMETIESALNSISSRSDVVAVEGAGGWLVPFNDKQDVADIALNNELPVVLVVGLKLGCINHARLTAESIQAKGGKLIGWIGNQIDPQMINVEENIDTLTQYIDSDCLGVIPFMDDVSDETTASYIDVTKLLRLLGLN